MQNYVFLVSLLNFPSYSIILWNIVVSEAYSVLNRPSGGFKMKRLFAFLAIVFIVYIIYYDIRIGTLPTAQDEKIEATEVIAQTSNDPYMEVKVKAGDTLLSIVERVNEEKQISSIKSVIKDFEELNPDSKAELLQIGKTYKFPLYTNE